MKRPLLFGTNYSRGRIILTILLLFVPTRLVLTLVGTYVVQHDVFQHGDQLRRFAFHEHTALDLWGRYDTGWYLDIAKHGYPTNTETKEPHEQYSFFPLLPAILAGLHALTGIDHFLLGLVVCNGCFLLAATLLFAYCRLKNEALAVPTIVALFASPVSFLFSSVMTEPLFLLICVSFFLQLAHRNLIWASILVGLAILCRPTGAFLTPILVVALWNERGTTLRSASRAMASIALPTAAVGILMAINARCTGDPFTFLHNPGYQGSPSFPWLNLYNGFRSIPSAPAFLAGYTVIAIAIWLLGVAHASWQQHLFIAACILVPLSFGLMSMPRMIAVAFPLYMIMAGLSQKVRYGAVIFPVLFVIQFVCFLYWIGNTGAII